MKNITLAVDETVLARVRVYAAKRNTTVNRLVRDHLEELARDEAKPDAARERLLELIDNSPGRLGPNWTWNREDVYEDRVLPRHEHPPVRGAGKK
ncbi:hypothetical protein [Rhodoplanes azumiensis]|uniref:Ribbon-helix-helix protein CopG domain-containing protein n=1 Tax=Rhodoplanes azumiensis TaxID=1897628 RepID=A0ABW5AKP6_9BRAD